MFGCRRNILSVMSANLAISYDSNVYSRPGNRKCKRRPEHFVPQLLYNVAPYGKRVKDVLNLSTRCRVASSRTPLDFPRKSW